MIHAEVSGDGADGSAAGVQRGDVGSDPLTKRGWARAPEKKPKGIQRHRAKPLRTPRPAARRRRRRDRRRDGRGRGAGGGGNDDRTGGRPAGAHAPRARRRAGPSRCGAARRWPAWGAAATRRATDSIAMSATGCRWAAASWERRGWGSARPSTAGTTGSATASIQTQEARGNRPGRPCEQENRRRLHKPHVGRNVVSSTEAAVSSPGISNLRRPTEKRGWTQRGRQAGDG